MPHSLDMRMCARNPSSVVEPAALESADVVVVGVHNMLMCAVLCRFFVLLLLLFGIIMPDGTG